MAEGGDVSDEAAIGGTFWGVTVSDSVFGASMTDGDEVSVDTDDLRTGVSGFGINVSTKAVVLMVGVAGEKRSVDGDVDCDLCGVEGDASSLGTDEVSDDLTAVARSTSGEEGFDVEASD